MEKHSLYLNAIRIISMSLLYLIVSTAHGAEGSPFQVHIEAEVATISSSELFQDFARIYQEMTEKIGAQLQDSLIVVVRTPDPNLSFRGRIMGKRIEITYPGGSSIERVFGIFAHELGHHLHAAWIEGRSVDHLFNEGFATWLAGEYWLAWHQLPSFASAVRTYIREETYIPLFGEDGNAGFHVQIREVHIRDVQTRDILYNEWAGFVEYLIQEFGWEQFASYCQLIAPRDNIVDTRAAMRKVYGVTHQHELEKAWLEWLSE